MQFLRARYLDQGTGHFTSRDLWSGNNKRPLSLNKWAYVEGNPVNRIDPSGFISEAEEADKIYNELLGIYNVKTNKDWGSIDELHWLKFGLYLIASKNGGTSKFSSAMGNKTTHINRIPKLTPDQLIYSGGRDTAIATPPGLDWLWGDIVLPDIVFNSDEHYAIYTIIHEVGHHWDKRQNYVPSVGMMKTLGTISNSFLFDTCLSLMYSPSVPEAIGLCALSYYDYQSGIEEAPGNTKYIIPYAGNTAFEDWAEAFATYIYPVYHYNRGNRTIGPIRRQYVIDQINNIK